MTAFCDFYRELLDCIESKLEALATDAAVSAGSDGPSLAAWRATAQDAAVAGGIAAVISGAPSTLHALVRGADPLEASLAAGTLVLPREGRPSRLLVAAAVVHLTLSFGWALALALVLPRRHASAWATLAGMGIAALDLGVIGRRFPRIRALPLLPQVADHLAYAWTVAAVLAKRSRSRDAGA